MFLGIAPWMDQFWPIQSQDGFIFFVQKVKYFIVSKVSQLKESNNNKYRKSFLVSPRAEECEYNKVNVNLDEIFTVKETRRITSGQTFSWNAKKHIILSDKNLSNGILEVRTYLDGSSKFYYRGEEVIVELFDEEYKKAA